MRRDRAVSSVVGVVLILGISIAAITSMMVIGTMAMNTTKTDAQLSQMENGISEMSSKASLVALGDSESHQFNLGDLGDGTVQITEDSGSLVIQSDGENIQDSNLGSLRYNHDDVEIAYEGGGVWKKSNGHTEMISPPEFHYQGHTLTLPTIMVTGEDSTSGSATGVITREEASRQTHPHENNPLTDGSIEITVESDFCGGWEYYFEQRTQSEFIEYCSDGEEDRIQIELLAENPLSYETTVTSTDGYDGPPGSSGGVESDRTVGELPDVEPVIQEKISECEDSNDCRDIDSENTLGPGDPYFASVDEGETYVIDSLDFETGNEVVDVVIDGDARFDGDLSITDTAEGSVNLFVSGDLELTGADINANDNSNDASRMNIIVGDHISGDGQGQSDIYAVIYAPYTTDETRLNSVNIHGALFVESIDLGGSANIKSDDNLTDGELDIGLELDVVTYLHTSENEIVISLD